MLLKDRIESPDQRIYVGQFSLIIGLFLQRFGPRLPGLAGNDFWAGLTNGVSVALLSLSILLNVSGAMALRRYRQK